MASRFVRPDTKTLPLSGGDSLTVRKRLTTGEQRAMFAQMYLAGVDGQLRVNPFQSGVCKVVAYLVDWTFTDDAGRRVAIAGLSSDDLRAVIDGLSPEDFAEIRQAIDAHEEAEAAERADAKKTQGGKPESAATLPSPSAATGLLTTSAT